MWAVIVVTVAAVVVAIRWRRSGQAWVDFFGLAAVRAVTKLWHGWAADGPAPLPTDGPAIVVANHTCSADPAFLQTGCARWLSFVIAREFYHIPRLRRLFEFLGCVPVNRSEPDVVGLRTALKRLREGRVVCIFPEGNLSNAGCGRPRSGKPGVAYLALRSRAPVLPALITGGPQDCEVVRAWVRPSRVRVRYGPPVDLSAYYGRPMDRKLLDEVTRLLMDRVMALDPACRNGGTIARRRQ